MKNRRVTNGAVITIQLISITISIVQKPIAILFSDYVDLAIVLTISKTSKPLLYSHNTFYSKFV